MITKLDIANYKSCLKTTVKLQPQLTVLVGANGSGKTNVLSAIMLLQKLSTGSRERRFLQLDADAALSGCSLGCSFQHNSTSGTYHAKLEIDVDDSNNDVIVNSRQSWQMRAFTGQRSRVNADLDTIYDLSDDESNFYPVSMTRSQRGNRAYIEYDSPPSGFIGPALAFARFAHGFKYYSASKFTDPRTCPVSFEVDKSETMRRPARIMRGHAKFLYDLYSESIRKKSSSYQQYMSIIGPDGLHLVDSVSFQEILTSSVEYRVQSGGRVHKKMRERVLVVPQFKIRKNELSPSQLSEGTFKTISLLFYLVTDRSTALLIEEPEVCVHHGLLSSIIELISRYARTKQVILSTHSDHLLDQVSPQDVCTVTNTKEGTVVKPLSKAMSKQNYKALKSYLETEGNLGEYWRHAGFE